MELRLDGALGTTAARRLDEHLGACSSCGAVYELLKAEDELLEKAMQADVSSAAELGRINELVRERTVYGRFRFAVAWETISEMILPLVPGPALGTLSGLLVLVSGQFDGAAVREAITRSLSPAGGFPVAIASALAAVCLVLGVLMVLPSMSGAASLNTQKENGHV